LPISTGSDDFAPAGPMPGALDLVLVVVEQLAQGLAVFLRCPSYVPANLLCNQGCRGESGEALSQRVQVWHSSFQGEAFSIEAATSRSFSTSLGNSGNSAGNSFGRKERMPVRAFHLRLWRDSTRLMSQHPAHF
jgi:hypothetical protein